MTLFLVYLLMTLPKIGVFLGMASAVCIALSLLVGICSIVENEFIFLKKTVICGAIAALLCVLTPDKQTSYVLAGTYVTGLAIESEVGQEVLSLVKDQIKKSIKE